ncbi:MAG: element excision factor XisH family protein [Oscillochloridaceae bacterium umkhey_bin13]
MAAEQGRQKIAVEIKSMQEESHSPITDVHSAIGQYLLYRTWLDQQEPDRVLYLAVNHTVADNLLLRPGVRAVLDRYGVHVIVVDVITEEVVRWEQR